MKKIIILLILSILPINVLAASGSIKASTSSTKVTLNNTVSVTIKVNSTDILGSWQFNVSYDKSKLSLQSGDTTVVGYNNDGSNIKNKSYTYKFKAIATGSATISVDNAKIADYETEAYISTTTSNLTLSIKEPVIINYSSDNNLKSLKIDGFEISPEFNKSTLNYSATVTPNTTKIKISAETNDSKAKVSGTGEKEVKEGTNSFDIEVTAENGSKKTYKLNVVVPEKDPVKSTFGKEEYSILRKLPENVPVNFNTNTININGEDVPCLQNEKLNLTLLYLRNSKNEEGFYIYDLTHKTVSLYNEIVNNDISIYLVSPIKELDNLIESKISINGEEIKAYQIRENSKNYIIYGKDVSTGKGAYYVYDKDNRTLSLFNEDDFNYLLEHNDIYKTITYAFSALIFIEFIIIILTNSTKKKMNKMINKLSEDKHLEEKKNAKK